MADEKEGMEETPQPESAVTETKEGLEAKAREAIKKLSPKEIRSLRKAYFTVRRSTVVVCEHKYVPNDFPRHRNCESCWFAFYNDHGDLVKQLDEIFQEHGKAALDNLAGTKQATMFLRFMSTVAKMTKEATPLPPQNGEANDGNSLSLASGTIDEGRQIPAVVSDTAGVEQKVQDQRISG